MEDFIPRASVKTVVTIRLDDTMLQMLNRAATRYGLSRNRLITQCIRYALERLPGPISPNKSGNHPER